MAINIFNILPPRYMKRIALLLAALFMTSCTYNVSMAHTEGTATDTIQDTQTDTPTVSPQFSIPLPKGLT